MDSMEDFNISRNKKTHLQTSTSIPGALQRVVEISQQREIQGPKPASPHSEVGSNDSPAWTPTEHSGFQGMQFMYPNAGPHMDNLTVAGHLIQPPLGSYATTVYVGNLLWWTTDVQIEGAASQYGCIKELKFFEESNGKSKGCCRVEFHDPVAAAACQCNMNGYIFNGRPCIVTYDIPQEMQQVEDRQASERNVIVVSGRMSVNLEVERGDNTDNRTETYRRHYARGRGAQGGQGRANGGPKGRPARGRAISVRMRR